MTELGDAILLLLSPGEVLAFYRCCNSLMGKQQIAADPGPLKLILPGGYWLQSMFRDGFNLTLISGSEDMLLYGLSKLCISARATTHSKSRYWSAVLIVSKDAKIVPCSAALLPLSGFVCPSREANSVEDRVDEFAMLRTVNLSYGSDVMSIWMPLREQPTDSSIAVPKSVFEGFVPRRTVPDLADYNEETMMRFRQALERCMN